jgi:PPOX class probable F420-dependent enzyme
MSTPTLPAGHAELLDRPLFAHLATERPDGGLQSSVMWYAWDGELIRFTHTTKRQKYRNLTHQPLVALSIADPDNPYDSLEVRGEVVSIDPDPDGRFYRSLQERYGLNYPITDADVRVVVTVRPTTFVPVTGGYTDREAAAARDAT